MDCVVGCKPDVSGAGVVAVFCVWGGLPWVSRAVAIDR